MRDLARLRTMNAVVSVLMMLLFVFHGVGNVFQMMGVGTPLSKVLSWTLVALCGIHTLIGVVLTVATLRSQREAGVSYPTQSFRFWLVRISGLAIALIIVAHVVIFLKPAGASLRLNVFQVPQLVLSILLVVTIGLHVLANMEPLMVSLGIGPARERAWDFMVVLAVLLVFMAAGFIIYYLRWSVI